MDNATEVFRDIYNKEKVTELFRAREMTEEEIKYVIIDESPNFTKEMFDEFIEKMKKNTYKILDEHIEQMATPNIKLPKEELDD